MIYKKPTPIKPEAKGTLRLRRLLEGKGWYVGKVGGGPYTIGWPDLYCHHPIYGHKWIEMKTPGRKLRASQIKRFIDLHKSGDKIYVLHDEKEYMVLFRDYDNWEQYR